MKTKKSVKLRVLKKDVPTEVLGIDSEYLRTINLTLRAVNHRIRLQILDRLQDVDGSTRDEMAELLRKERSVASQHLNILKKAGLVSFREEDKKYLINLDELNRIKELTEEVS